MDYKSLIEQVQVEYKIAYGFIQSKQAEWLRRLKLYNNQRRDPAAVGDTLLFTVFQTILASLYDDTLIAKFEGYTEGDADVEQNLNSLAEFDHRKMEKDIIDYEWIWDACFFGRSLLLFNTFERKKIIPVPEAIDPTSWLRDPDAQSVNGSPIMKLNAMRFGGREIQKTQFEMDSNPDYFNLGKLRFEDNPMSLGNQAHDARADAANLNQSTLGYNEDLKDNGRYKLLQWFTFWKGKKVLAEFGNNISEVVRYKELQSELWPIIDRPLYPTAHEWDGVSIPDICEDKQRGRSVITNLAFRGLKLRMYPSYIYDENLITNKNDLMNIDFNRFIPAKGNPASAITPMQKDPMVMETVDYILQSLDESAQRATATPEMQQGVMSKNQRTLGELSLINSKVDIRYSLAAKVFGWSERRFWQQWYWLYKKHFKQEIDEKIIRIEGAFGPKWRPLTRDNFISEIADPDVYVDSKILSEARRIRKLNEYREFFQVLLTDPNANRRYAIRKLGELHNFKKDEMERMLPPTPDEMLAESENERLNTNTFVAVNVTDDHIAHLEVHAKAADTKSTYGHIEAHKEALRLKKIKPDLFPATPVNQEAGMNQTVANVLNTQQLQNGSRSISVQTNKLSSTALNA